MNFISRPPPTKRDQQLEQAGQHGDGEQGGGDGGWAQPGGREHHRRAGEQRHAGTGRTADQADRAANGAGDQQQEDRADQAGQRAGRGPKRGGEYGHAEGGGLRQHHGGADQAAALVSKKSGGKLHSLEARRVEKRSHGVG